jgi:hypothetical protein
MSIPPDSQEISDLLERLIRKLDRGSSPDNKWPDSNGEYWGLCPFHTDVHPGSFSVSVKGYHCFACGEKGGLRKLVRKLYVDEPNLLQTHQSTGLTLEAYSQAKLLLIEFLQGLGIRERKSNGVPCLVIPYFDQHGQEIAVRYRFAMNGNQRFRWKKGNQTIPYGLWKLDEELHGCTVAGGDKPFIFLVEGESDTQTLWLHNIPALGIPGATTWKTAWGQFSKGARVYVWQEPDDAGAEFVKRIAATLPEALIVSPPPGRKDISDCHVRGDNIPELIQSLIQTARPYRELEDKQLEAQAKQAFLEAQPLLNGNILDQVVAYCRTAGLVGEEEMIRLLYLIVTSRLLEQPISIAVKGPSSGGKSFIVQIVLDMFPTSAFYKLTGMSEKALAYSKEPLKHRMLVIIEAAGLNSEFASYLLRTLLSEGYIRYEYVEKTSAGLTPRLIEREGPTGVVLTTTAISLHPENETRLISSTVRDDPEQTRGIMRSLAAKANGKSSTQLDPAPWHALQRWLELAGVKQVSIPYAETLADMTSPAAVRIRRDFGTILNLIRAHAILNQSKRNLDQDGRIIATIEDYRVIYTLVGNLISEGVDRSVSRIVRETVEAVRSLLANANDVASVNQVELASFLKLDTGTVSRRVKQALNLGHLVNLEGKRGRPYKLQLGTKISKDRSVLPTPEDLENNIVVILPISTATVQPLRPVTFPGHSRPNLVEYSHPDISRPCFACHEIAWRERPVKAGGGFYCSVCHPYLGISND